MIREMNAHIHFLAKVMLSHKTWRAFSLFVNSQTTYGPSHMSPWEGAKWLKVLCTFMIVIVIQVRLSQEESAQHPEPQGPSPLLNTCRHYLRRWPLTRNLKSAIPDSVKVFPKTAMTLVRIWVLLCCSIFKVCGVSRGPSLSPCELPQRGLDRLGKS